MNFSNLVTALQEGNDQEVNRLIEALRPRLMAFLRTHMNADHADAEDCAQDSLIISIEIIKEGRLKNPDHVLSYILSTCRNNYLKMQNKKLDQADSDPDEYHNPPPQLQSLLDEEQEKLLERCMSQLRKEYQKFMQYWFDHPDSHAEKVAEKFDISVSNVWTRKHRLIKKLNKCYREKSKL